MALKCDEKSVYTLFNEFTTLEIPMYQRSYAWETDTVTNFVDDIRECLDSRITNPMKPRHHFFGGVVSITSANQSLMQKKVEIIDGQQRLTTFVLFVSVLVHKIDKYLESCSASNSDDANQKLTDHSDGFKLDYVIYKDRHDSSTGEKLRLRPTNVDKDYFASLLRDGISKQTKNPSEGSHKRLKAAWLTLEKFVDGEIVNTDFKCEKILEKLYSLRAVLQNDCTFIFISTSTPEDAYRYFLVLNDRGERLTTGDLLRARTLGILEEEGVSGFARDISSRWSDILKDRSKSDVEKYFKWYFESLTGKRPKKLNLPGQYIDEVFHINDNVNRSEKVERIKNVVAQMQKDFDMIRGLKNGEWLSEKNNTATNWDKERLRSLICSLGHTQAIPLLLAMSELDTKSFYDAVASLERFFFRFKTIGQQHAGKMEDVYRCYCKKLRENTNFYSLQKFRRELKKLVFEQVDDDIFTRRLEQLTYDASNKKRKDAIKVLLIALESYWDWYDDGRNTIPVCKNKESSIESSIVSIEHIYPQNADSQRIDDDLEDVKHLLGNLSLLGGVQNSELKNKGFDDKRDNFSSSNIRLNRWVGDQKTWTIREFNQRHKYMLKMAVSIFKP